MPIENSEIAKDSRSSCRMSKNLETRWDDRNRDFVEISRVWLLKSVMKGSSITITVAERVRSVSRATCKILRSRNGLSSRVAQRRRASCIHTPGTIIHLPNTNPTCYWMPRHVNIMPLTSRNLCRKASFFRAFERRVTIDGSVSAKSMAIHSRNTFASRRRRENVNDVNSSCSEAEYANSIFTGLIHGIKSFSESSWWNKSKDD